MSRDRQNVACSAPDCRRRAHAKGLCVTHYGRTLTGVPLDRPIPKHGLTLLERVEEKSIPEPNTGCWLWLGPLPNHGYPVMAFAGKRARVSRALLGLTDSKVFACHRCDTPSCVNPSHIYAGSCLDNARDALVRNRQVRGERQGRAKLNDESVRDIIRLHAAGETKASLARIHHVSETVIYSIVRGFRWRHVTEAAR